MFVGVASLEVLSRVMYCSSSAQPLKAMTLFPELLFFQMNKSG
jgi:hypothetical protein